jgi:hypothetical protein
VPVTAKSHHFLHLVRADNQCFSAIAGFRGLPTGVLLLLLATLFHQQRPLSVEFRSQLVLGRQHELVFSSEQLLVFVQHGVRVRRSNRKPCPISPHCKQLVENGNRLESLIRDTPIRPTQTIVASLVELTAPALRRLRTSIYGTGTVGAEKYDETAAAMIAQLKYGAEIRSAC